ncbi:MAG TPA: ParA family protein [Thermoanaerobaculia bacterium]|nr:ParA family protein [Thermoanaerobaculia bacterium]
MSEASHSTTAVVSSKGGVGKTTTTVNLAAALAGRGHTVLVVDLDCQASASLSLGLKRHQLAPSAADVMLRSEAAGAAARPTRLPGLWVLPASADLASVEADLAPLRTKERVLARALEPLRERFEHILIDCPPGLGLLSRNALVAADAYVAPAVPHFLAVEGLENLVQAVARLDFRCQSRTHFLGIIPTVVDLRLRTVRQNLEVIRATFGSSVFAIQVRTNARLAEAPALGGTVFEHDPDSVGADCHRLLAEEFLLRLQQALGAQAGGPPMGGAETVAMPDGEAALPF